MEVQWNSFPPGTFGFTAKRYLSRKTRRLMREPSAHQCRVVTRLVDRWGGLPLKSITRGRITDLSEDLQDQGYANNSVNAYLGFTQAILRYACYDKEWLDRVPQIVRLPGNERETVLSKEQAEKLFGELPEPRAAMARFAWNTGLRAENVRTLRWDQVRDNALHFDRDDVKSGKDFVIPLIGAAQKILKEQWATRRDSQYVFVKESDDKPVSRITNKTWRSAVKRAGLPSGTCFHSLRHSWATNAVSLGISDGMLLKLGGWSDSKMIRRYTHVNVNQLAEAAAVLDTLGL